MRSQRANRLVGLLGDLTPEARRGRVFVRSDSRKRDVDRRHREPRVAIVDGGQDVGVLLPAGPLEGEEGSEPPVRARLTLAHRRIVPSDLVHHEPGWVLSCRRSW